ncbi:radical SAM protein [Vitiosangium sp. GDMCC 1.1324]|uniref:radical SAM protein n=1 Tax=Vitiosangium sp. (strain GDMCC 1.1324) TaxID=2138576 RepID=UPI000D3C904E|nr:radical SAM protein [Vitiosangium sp. GDMCC 1.1324]PTL81123.1 rRNA methyltransferase [Vitiosangium sp. GDMCC 1.1324]
MKLNLKSLSLPELQQALAPAAPSPVAVRKVFASIFAHGASSLEEVCQAPQVPRRVADFLRENAEMTHLEVVERRKADDGFVKYLFASPLGGRVEAVRIPIFDEKYVVCVSSQVGCALACDFCMTGKLGFKRNLRTWEILDQVMQIRAEADRPVRGVVFMGMGEPLLNYAETLRAAQILSHPAGFAISGPSITFSTAGMVPAIRRYVSEGHPYRLAFSVTSAIAEKRLQVLPIEKAHPLPELVDAIREYATVRRERAMIAYVAISGFNLGREDALALKETFEGIPIKVDLIDVTDPTGKYLPPSPEELKAFRDHLQVLGAPIARRYSGGKDIGAACGTLEASQYGGVVLPPPESSA